MKVEKDVLLEDGEFRCYMWEAYRLAYRKNAVSENKQSMTAREALVLRIRALKEKGAGELCKRFRTVLDYTPEELEMLEAEMAAISEAVKKFAAVEESKAPIDVRRVTHVDVDVLLDARLYHAYKRMVWLLTKENPTESAKGVEDMAFYLLEQAALINGAIPGDGAVQAYSGILTTEVGDVQSCMEVLLTRYEAQDITYDFLDMVGRVQKLLTDSINNWAEGMCAVYAQRCKKELQSKEATKKETEEERIKRLGEEALGL